jgi:hypothetical protein
MYDWSTGFGQLQKPLPLPLGSRRCYLFVLQLLGSGRAQRLTYRLTAHPLGIL